MNLYFQFLTQNQSAEAAKMIEIISALTGDQTLSGRVKISAQAKVSSSKFSEIEGLSAKISEKRFNELEVLPEPLPKQLGGVDARVTAMNGVFYPSPISALWLSTKGWRIDADRSSRNKYMTAKTKETVLKFHNAATMPTAFEVAISISTKSSRETILDACADWLARMLPANLGMLRIFGCCDVGGAELGVALDTGVLATYRIRILAKTKPPAYPELGDLFEDLHPVIFGSERVCEGISKALGKEAKLMLSKQAKDFAVVRLSPKDQESARKRAANWLISAEMKEA